MGPMCISKHSRILKGHRYWLLQFLMDGFETKSLVFKDFEVRVELKLLILGRRLYPPDAQSAN